MKRWRAWVWSCVGLTTGCLQAGKYRITDDGSVDPARGAVSSPSSTTSDVSVVVATWVDASARDRRDAEARANSATVHLDSGASVIKPSEDAAATRGKPMGVGETGDGTYDADALDGGRVGSGCGWVKPSSSMQIVGCALGARYRQVGTDGEESAAGIAFGLEGSVWLTGTTTGKFPGQPTSGFEDAYLRGWTGEGETIGTIQLANTALMYPPRIATTTQGEVIVALTQTNGDGPHRLVVAAFTSMGVPTWTQVMDGPWEVVGMGLATDPSGGVFLTGWRQTGEETDAGVRPGNTFVSRLGADGVPLWTSEVPVVNAVNAFMEFDGEGVAVWRDGSVLVSGMLFTDLSAFPLGGRTKLTKFAANGDLVWQTVLDSSSFETFELGVQVTLDASGNILLGGRVGFNGAALELSPTGELLWAVDLGATSEPYPALSTDGDGNVYAAMTTDVVLSPTGYDGFGANPVSNDVFVAGLDANGSVQWTRQFGTPEDDVVTGVRWHAGALYVYGATHGDLAGRFGDSDAFVVQMVP